MLLVVLHVPCLLSVNPDFLFRSESDDVQTCRFNGNRSEGVCRPANECPGAVDDFQARGLVPTRCNGFVGGMPIVCCWRNDRKSEPLQLRISETRKCILLYCIINVEIPIGFINMIKTSSFLGNTRINQTITAPKFYYFYIYNIQLMLDACNNYCSGYC